MSQLFVPLFDRTDQVIDDIAERPHIRSVAARDFQLFAVSFRGGTDEGAFVAVAIRDEDGQKWHFREMRLQGLTQIVI